MSFRIKSLRFYRFHHLLHPNFTIIKSSPKSASDKNPVSNNFSPVGATGPIKVVPIGVSP